MGLFRWVLAGAAGYGVYRLGAASRPGGADAPAGRVDGLSALFRTRAEADLAIEHLVQEHHVERAFIYVEPVDAENSSGLEPSGGDHASGDPGSGERVDAPLHGAIELTVPITGHNAATLTRALEEVGAVRVESF
ncbi:MAG: hypothetical protein ABIT04_13285 [Novosphingobium sp.]